MVPTKQILKALVKLVTYCLWWFPRSINLVAPPFSFSSHSSTPHCPLTTSPIEKASSSKEKWLKFVCSWWGFSQCSPLPMATDMVVAGLMHMPPSMEEVMPQEQWVGHVDMETSTAKVMEQILLL